MYYEVWAHTQAGAVQSMLKPPEVHTFYRKIELCIIHMGDNDMHATCTHEQEMVDHVTPELQDKVPVCYN